MLKSYSSFLQQHRINKAPAKILWGSDTENSHPGASTGTTNRGGKYSCIFFGPDNVPHLILNPPPLTRTPLSPPTHQIHFSPLRPGSTLSMPERATATNAFDFHSLVSWPSLCASSLSCVAQGHVPPDRSAWFPPLCFHIKVGGAGAAVVHLEHMWFTYT